MMVKKYAARGVALALILVLAYVAALRAGSEDAHAAVTLLYFQGQHNGDSVLLEWATATELNTAYFYIERATVESGPYQTLDEIGLVASDAPPDGLSGAVYERVDHHQVSASLDYWYVLVEVENTHGVETRTDPVKVVFSNAQPTATSTPTTTRVPTNTPITVSSTLTPTPQTSAGPTSTLPGPTTTAVAASRFSTRSAGSSVDEQTGLNDSEPGEIADVSAAPQAFAQITATPRGDGYPALGGVDTQPSQSEPTRDGYPAAPPTPQVFTTESYPGAVAPRGLTNGSTIPNIGTVDQSPNDDPGEEQESPNDSPLLGTLFLWIGFGAALLVFVSAVTGAIYYYNRQRASNR